MSVAFIYSFRPPVVIFGSTVIGPDRAPARFQVFDEPGEFDFVIVPVAFLMIGEDGRSHRLRFLGV